MPTVGEHPPFDLRRHHKAAALMRRRPCAACDGTGWIDDAHHPCPDCLGTGEYPHEED